MYLLILLALVLYIVSDDRLVAVLSDRIDVETACPEVSSPELFFDFRVREEQLFRNDTFDRLHHSCREHSWDALDKKVHMIFVCTNLYELYFIALADLFTRLFQGFFCRIGQYGTTIFHRAHDMIEEKTSVVTFADMFAHSSILPDLLCRS